MYVPVRIMFAIAACATCSHPDVHDNASISGCLMWLGLMHTGCVHTSCLLRHDVPLIMRCAAASDSSLIKLVIQVD